MEKLNPNQIFKRSLTIPSDHGKTGLVQSFVENILKKTDFQSDTQHEILLALQEGVNNAIEHGNGGGMDQEVIVDITLFHTHLELRILDQGCGFDRNCVEDPTLPEHRLRSNGRGIMFIENFMDEICYSRSDDYHELKMIRFR